MSTDYYSITGMVPPTLHLRPGSVSVDPCIFMYLPLKSYNTVILLCVHSVPGCGLLLLLISMVAVRPALWR